MSDSAITEQTPSIGDAPTPITVRFDGGPLVALGFDGKVWLIRDDGMFDDVSDREARILRAMLEHALDRFPSRQP